jgi:hypothetical protein
LLLASSCCAIAAADGGRVVLSQRQGGYQITVFVSPDPPRAGPVDISVMLQNAVSGEPITDGQIDLTLTPRDRISPSISASATSAAATNKLLRAAIVELPTAGAWDAEIQIAGDGGPATVRFSLEAGQPLPRWLTVWPWFSWPLGAVILFAAHRRLVWQREQTNSLPH